MCIQAVFHEPEALLAARRPLELGVQPLQGRLEPKLQEERFGHDLVRGEQFPPDHAGPPSRSSATAWSSSAIRRSIGWWEPFQFSPSKASAISSFRSG